MKNSKRRNGEKVYSEEMNGREVQKTI